MPSNKNQAETSLSDLALNELGDRLPGLISHLLGFELINSNDENTRAAGVLGFDVNGQRILMPCLFLNGRVRAMEIMYLSDTDTFVSATPQWVEYITTRSSGITGEPDPAGKNVGTVPSNSLLIFNRGPQITKRAGLDEFAEWCGPEKAIVPDDAKPRFIEALRSMGKHAYINFMTDIVSHPELMERVMDYYSPEDLKLAEFADTAEIKQAAAAPAEKKLAFITPAELESDPKAFDLETKVAVMATGLAVMDKRAASEKSEFYSDDYSKSFTGVTASGLYGMINSLGEFVDVIVAHSPFNPRRPEDSRGSDYIFNPKSGVSYTARVGEDVLVRIRRSGDLKSYTEWMEKLPKVSSARPNKNYVLAGPRGEMSMPFRVFNRSTGKGVTSLEITSTDSGYLGGCCISISFGRSGSHGPSKPTANSLRIVGDGTNIKHIGDHVVIGSDWRIWEVADDCDCTESARKCRCKEEQALKPANASVISSAMSANGILELGVTKQANDYIVSLGGVNTERMRKNAAIKVLCGSVGLDSTKAIELVENAVPGIRTIGWVKRADIYNGMSFPEVQTDMGQDERGVREVTGHSSLTNIPMNNPEYPDVFNPDLANYDRLKKTDVEFLQRAADTGSNSVFDPAMIGILLKTNRTLIQVDQWVPDLVTALDRLCRTLLLFYWKNPDFSHGYGSDEMSELEDVMLSVIKSLGTIVLFFKQRASESPGTKIDAFSGN